LLGSKLKKSPPKTGEFENTGLWVLWLWGGGGFCVGCFVVGGGGGGVFEIWWFGGGGGLDFWVVCFGVFWGGFLWWGLCFWVWFVWFWCKVVFTVFARGLGPPPPPRTGNVTSSLNIGANAKKLSGGTCQETSGSSV